MFNYASPADEEGLDDEWSSERMAKRSPHLTFKRRNKLWKKHRETEGRGFPDSVESNCLFQKQCKRRRLVRPMFRDKSSDIICYSCSNLQMPSQESSADKKNSGSCEAPNNSERIDDNEDGLSRKDLVPSMKCPITCEGDSREAGGILADDDSNLGELAGAGNCRLSDAAVTKPLKTYRHRRLASLCIKGTDKKIIEDEGKHYLTRIVVSLSLIRGCIESTSSTLGSSSRRHNPLGDCSGFLLTFRMRL
ncbi:hypothetical protein L1049_020533 [Liquidambar formosana]|uniref:Uncharacterized protein n=1 Tax=Liquidambar formosana TaxID=63359 RepID=A0AAP0SBG8_LIQFO